MKKNKRIIKNFCKFENFDFNTIAELFKNYHTKSILSSMWNNEYVLNSTFQIRDVQYNKMFSNLYKKLNTFYNLPEHYHSNLDVFFSFAPGTSSVTHKDKYNVAILATHNDVVVRIENEKYILNPGDLINIYANETHQIIGIEPRIIISYGYTIKGEKL